MDCRFGEEWVERKCKIDEVGYVLTFALGHDIADIGAVGNLACVQRGFLPVSQRSTKPSSRIISFFAFNRSRRQPLFWSSRDAMRDKGRTFLGILPE